MKLLFENNLGHRRVIQDNCNTWEDVNKAIDTFVAKCNADKYKMAKERYGKEYDSSKVKPFKRYYTRIWEEDDMTKIDIGSHTEFFYWEGKFNTMTILPDGEAEFEYE